MGLCVDLTDRPIDKILQNFGASKKVFENFDPLFESVEAVILINVQHKHSIGTYMAQARNKRGASGEGSSTSKKKKKVADVVEVMEDNVANQGKAGVEYVREGVVEVGGRGGTEDAGKEIVGGARNNVVDIAETNMDKTNTMDKDAALEDDMSHDEP